ncbi:MAG: GTPase HflX [Kiritimatiellae bacterium]|nr:GTPase HflX [Kiritimatiellia bacterium]
MASKFYDTARVERAVLAQVVLTRNDAAEAADSLAELARLADTAGLEVVGQLTQNRERPDGGTLLGSGKVEELRVVLEQTQANTVVFDNPLNAIQAHQLGKTLRGIRVLDRTEVILEIFARRARSAEAKIQVELAKTAFLLSRIPETEAQQRFGGGGTGLRGPGESHLHLRNAPLRRRITDLKRKLETIRKRQTDQSRAHRQWPVVSLVGYTNAGKSTLLNAFTRADAYVDDRLFPTLDTKTRHAWLSPARQVLLTDTVGFIRNLPHNLVACFKSTLQTAVDSDLLLVVVDATSPRLADHIAVCRETLKEIGAEGVPHLLVLNKCDEGRAGHAVLHATEAYPQAVPVSARSGYGLDLLKQAMIEELQRCCTLWRLPSAISEI